MNVSLTDELEAFVQRKVASGRYYSASEVVREALRLLEEHDRVQEMRLERLRREVAVGLEELDRGEGREIDFEELKAEGRRRLEERRRTDKCRESSTLRSYATPKNPPRLANPGTGWALPEELMLYRARP